MVLQRRSFVTNSASELVLEDSLGRTHRVAMKEKERGSHWPAQVELVSRSPLTVLVCEGGRVGAEPLPHPSSVGPPGS